ncbi:unnamed protein product [Durusdinium trenchii]|uniref:Uncharacterized protein n=1 Tax=Durusdinium trenchii TaxID=1381693 RepID=A0ABP0NDT4_9DINO
MQPGESVVPILHICVMGASGSGKTCLINSWVNSIVPSVYIPTTETTKYYRSMLLPNALHDGEAVTTLVEVEEAAWPQDAEGQPVDAQDYGKRFLERFRPCADVPSMHCRTPRFQEQEARSDSMMSSYTHPMTDFQPDAPERLAKGRMCFIVLFDVTSSESMETAITILKEMKESSRSGFRSRGMKVRLVANKIDLETVENSEVIKDNTTKASELCWDTEGMDFREVSALEYRGVRALFRDLLEETIAKTDHWATSAMKRQTEDRKKRLLGKDNCHVM